MPRYKAVFWKLTSLVPVLEEEITAVSMKLALHMARQRAKKLRCDHVDVTEVVS